MRCHATGNVDSHRTPSAGNLSSIRLALEFGGQGDKDTNELPPQEKDNSTESTGRQPLGHRANFVLVGLPSGFS